MLFCQGMSCRTRRLCISYPATIDIFINQLWCDEHARSQVFPSLLPNNLGFFLPSSRPRSSMVKFLSIILSMNIHIIPAHDRYTARHSWLESKHLFSFADYYDPDNVHFGTLRVFNDDVIDGHQGFDMHPHKNMEIITLVLSGEISHADTHGGLATVGPGGVQVMSAGSGLMHSEKNQGEEAVHLYQIWIGPREEGIEPRHDERDFSQMEHNKLVPLAS